MLVNWLLVVSERVGVLIYGPWCLYMGWDFRLEDGVFVYGMECYKRDRVLLHGMGC